jgi:hypothetical protein
VHSRIEVPSEMLTQEEKEKVAKFRSLGKKIRRHEGVRALKKDHLGSMAGRQPALKQP